MSLNHEWMGKTKYQDPNQLEQEHITVDGHIRTTEGREGPTPGRPA